MPRIIRLLKFGKVRPAAVRLSRRNIFARDDHRCQYCGKRFPSSELNLDHVVPQCQGGQTRWDNLVCSCVNCNDRKGGRTPEQAGITLIRKPEKPRIVPVRARIRHDSWKNFLSDLYWDVELVD